MFMFGVQNDSPRYCARLPVRRAYVFFARASSLTAQNTLYTRLSFHDAAIPIVTGKTVAVPLRPTPCSASFHHSNCGMPSLGIAGELFIISDIFSSTVSLEHRSSARCDGVSDASIYGSR